MQQDLTTPLLLQHLSLALHQGSGLLHKAVKGQAEESGSECERGRGKRGEG